MSVDVYLCSLWHVWAHKGIPTSFQHIVQNQKPPFGETQQESRCNHRNAALPGCCCCFFFSIQWNKGQHLKLRNHVIYPRKRERENKASMYRGFLSGRSRVAQRSATGLPSDGEMMPGARAACRHRCPVAQGEQSANHYWLTAAVVLMPWQQSTSGLFWVDKIIQAPKTLLKTKPNKNIYFTAWRQCSSKYCALVSVALSTEIAGASILPPIFHITVFEESLLLINSVSEWDAGSPWTTLWQTPPSDDAYPSLV